MKYFMSAGHEKVLHTKVCTQCVAHRDQKTESESDQTGENELHFSYELCSYAVSLDTCVASETIISNLCEKQRKAHLQQIFMIIRKCSKQMSVGRNLRI